jgi:hypothetical protein
MTFLHLNFNDRAGATTGRRDETFTVASIEKA